MARIPLALLALAALALLGWQFSELLQIGTCASGGPYVSARECPDGTATHILLLAAGLVGAMLFGMAAFGFAGAFGLLFTVMGGVWLVMEATGRTAEGSGGVGYYVGGMFLVMGLVPLWFAIRDLLDGDDDLPAVPASYGIAAQVQMSANAATRAQPPAPPHQPNG
ncbi:MAG: hypothetical protein HZB46_00945 [Solirubrobacterales bacterium]|nr:hypothetical protein [Solirubrobacterales bacterium]